MRMQIMKTNSSLRYFLLYIFPVIVWVICIFTLSSIPFTPTIKPLFRYFDKVVHFIEYGILGYFSSRAIYNHHYSKAKKYAVFFSILFGCFFAVADEYHQIFVPGRINSFGDFLADAGGLIIVQIPFIIRNMNINKIPNKQDIKFQKKHQV